MFLVVSILYGSGELVTRVRDLIPWFYLLLLPAVVQWAMAAGHRRILDYLTITLLAHTAWAVPALADILPEIDIGLAVLGQPLFGERADVDVPLLAAAGVLVFYRWGSRFSTIISALLMTGAATAQTSRAALVGSVLAIGVFARVRGHLQGARGGIRLLATAVVVTVAVFVILPLVAARQGDRFDLGALARAGVYGSASASASGDGTADDRFQAWDVLLHEYAEKGYPALGSGAGAEIIRDTGTLPYFGGIEETRAPHNWWVHMVVRTGYIGALLWVVLLISGSHVLDRTRRKERDFHTAVGALLAASMLLTSTFGVVVEAPFGSQILLLGVALYGLRAQRSCIPLSVVSEDSRSYDPEHSRLRHRHWTKAWTS